MTQAQTSISRELKIAGVLLLAGFVCSDDDRQLDLEIAAGFSALCRNWRVTDRGGNSDISFFHRRSWWSFGPGKAASS